MRELFITNFSETTRKRGSSIRLYSYYHCSLSLSVFLSIYIYNKKCYTCRSYYRCTYRNTQNCWATKQVQRSDDDHTIFDITYRGIHTCSHGQQQIPPPASPEKQEQKQNIDQQQQSQAALFNFQKVLRVNTEDLDNKEMAFPFSFPPTYGSTKTSGTYSQSFTSPATPESNYYSVSPFQMNNYAGVQNLQHHSESGFTELISANTSAANSPIVEPDFSLQSLELDPNFPFNTPGFSLNSIM